MTALARVELGAMLAGFTEHPNPFAAVMGKGYDIVEFKEMLIDGAKIHFWALVNDPDFAEATKTFKPNGQTLTYVRRLNVATAFVYSAGGLTGLELNPLQKEEVATYAKNLDDARSSFQAAIQLYLTTVFSQTNTKSNSTNQRANLSSSAITEFAVPSAMAGPAGGTNGCTEQANAGGSDVTPRVDSPDKHRRSRVHGAIAYAPATFTNFCSV